MINKGFWKNKKVLITGHTGFKGSWLCKMLVYLGAEVTGYSLEPPTNPNLFDICGIKGQIYSVMGDVRDLEKLMKIVMKVRPEVIVHLAAQPIVRDSYKNPVYTYETNVMGTVNICECVRLNSCVKSLINVTTDKVYKNNEWIWGYRENDLLDGYEPYSNSKSCSELITNSYKRSFLNDLDVAISTVRAGNVIGGGDFASDRIIPDCVRAIEKKEDIIVRNPFSVRPYQYVLEPLAAYLQIAQAQYEDKKYQGSYNIGPDEVNCVSTGKLVSVFCDKWGDKIIWKDVSEENAPHETNYLKLDCCKIKNVLGWKSIWNIEEAVEKIVEWTKVYLNNGDVANTMDKELKGFFNR